MLSQEQILEIKDHLDAGLSKTETARRLNLSIGSVYKYSELGNFVLEQSPSTIKLKYLEGFNLSKKFFGFENNIKELLKNKVFNASKFYQELIKLGFRGSYALVNNLIRKKELERYPSKVRIYNKVETEPGQQAQVDWGHFGEIEINDRLHKLYVFVYVLSYSRAMYAEFVTNQKQKTLQMCHQNAFKKLGIPKTILYDNMKTVVIGRTKIEGIKIPEFNFDFTNFASHYGFKPTASPPYYPQSKGKVESGVKYIRNNFMNGENLKKISTPLDELNSQLFEWLDTVANVRIHYTTKEKPIIRWQKEKEHLQPFDDFPEYEINYESIRRSSQNSMVNYKRSCYCVPREYARKKINTKELKIDGVDSVQFLYQGSVIAQYPLALKVGSWILPKNDSLLLKKKKLSDKKERKEKIWAIKVQKNDLRFYNQFIK